MAMVGAWGATEWLAAASTVASAAAGGVGYAQAAESARARQQAATYQAAVATNNQKIAEQYAADAVARGQRLEDAKRQATAQQEGSIRAAAGASNVDANSGSALRLQSDTAMVGELDAQTIRANAAREAYGYRVKGMDYAASAQLDEMAARDAANSGALGEFSSIIGSAESISSRWARFTRGGI